VEFLALDKCYNYFSPPPIEEIDISALFIIFVDSLLFIDNSSLMTTGAPDGPEPVAGMEMYYFFKVIDNSSALVHRLVHNFIAAKFLRFENN
jgi:hypothetical protein